MTAERKCQEGNTPARSTSKTDDVLSRGGRNQAAGARASTIAANDSRLLIPEGAVYATARQLAHRYQVSTRWVGARAEHLGATPISESTNSGLRYHVATADAYMQSRQRRALAPVPRKPKADKTPKKTRTGAPLLSFR